MKAKLLLAFLAAQLTIIGSLSAQTFTLANDDGVEIKYTVIDANAVQVESNNYQGRVIVPASVTYEDTTYAVTKVFNRAFNNCANLTYLQLPESINVIGALAFVNSGLDTLVINSDAPPLNPYGYNYTEETVRALFGNNLVKTVTVVVPAGQLPYYRFNGWGCITNLTSPIAVPVTMFAPFNTLLVVGNQNLKTYTQPAAYYTMYFEVGEKVWMVTYHNNTDTVFLGWDKGDVFLTEITGPDTLRPILAPVAYSTLTANNVSTIVKFNGQMGYHNGTANYFVPANSTTSPMYANSLWISGIRNTDSLFRACAMRFLADDYVPGPLTVDGLGTSDLATRIAFNRVWNVSRQDIDDFIAHVGTSGYSIPENILSWPGNGPEGYAQQLAPYYDADSDGVYNPHHGDYPLIRGDRMCFSIFNDHCIHGATASYPMNVEIHMSAYAFDEPQDTALNNTVFLSFKIFNRSNTSYYDTWVSAFTDFDVGYGYDDYIGCDVRAGMAYAYNGMETDNYYPGVPPAQGSIILAGPYADPDARDNSRVDIEKMQALFPEQLAGYLNSENSYDMVRLNADADLYYPSAWALVPGFSNSLNPLNSSINGLNYGNGIVDDERMGMCNFVYYENSTNSINGEPSSFSDYLNYQRGIWKNYQNIHYGGNGINYEITDLPCMFMFPGDSDPLHWGTGGLVPSINPDSWTEITSFNAPGDRRGIQSSGPFSFQIGQTQTLDLAFTTAFGNVDAASSVQKLRQHALNVRRQFARDTTTSQRPFTYMPYSAPIIGIDNASQPSLQIYPNPANNHVCVALGESNPTTITVYNIQGIKVIEVPNATGLVNIDISGLQRGIYILHCGNTTARLVKK